MGLPVICIDARHAKAALKMQINKSDRNDAVGMARIMQLTETLPEAGSSPRRPEPCDAGCCQLIP